MLVYKNIVIRNATVADAVLLETWWNDGKVMAHAGFPNGTGQTAESIAEKIKSDADRVHRRMIIELAGVPIGETSYGNVSDGIAEIGIKICDFSQQNQGYGKIILDTNLNNKRAQHVYEQLGFRKVRERENSWRNQLGELQSSVDYELEKPEFIDYAR